jgi:hypothetical protein
VSDRVPSNSPHAVWYRAFGLAWACAALTASVAIAWLIDAPVASRIAGHSIWGVSALAAGICWFGAMLSLVLLHVLRLRGSPVAGVLVGMLVRMTIPLSIAFMATTQEGSLAEAGLLGQLVVFYLVTLAIETCLSLALTKSVPQAALVRSHGSVSHG